MINNVYNNKYCCVDGLFLIYFRKHNGDDHTKYNSQLKSQLKGWRSCDADDIIKNGTEEPKRFSKNSWQEFIIT
jgi:hypothetical protein